MLAIIVVAAASATILGSRISPKAHAFSAPVTGLSMPGVGSSIPASQDSSVTAPPITQTQRGPQPVPSAAQGVALAMSMLNAPTSAASPTDVVPTQTPVVSADEGAAVRAAATASAPDLPAYQVYQVQDGDTLTSIAAHFGIDPQYIPANNPEILNADFLQLGQSLIIPAGNGILHEVQYGETLSDIAAKYNVDVSSITGFAANHIQNADDIQQTALLFVPNAQIPPPLPAAAPDAGGNGGGTGGSGDGSSPAPQPTPVPPPPPADNGSPPPSNPGPSSGRGLIWPVSGRTLSSCYCPWHPLGIDIDGYNLPGAPVVAATDGTVIFAGGNPCCSYGLYVRVLSPSGIETLYGHFSSIAVTQGQQVAQGTTLGIIGSTGNSTGRHLHFEVIDNGTRENPLDYLPPGAICEAGQTGC